VGSLIRKRGKCFEKRVTNAREVTQFTEILKKGKPSIVRIRYSKKTLKNFIEIWVRRI
jgi:hypothetical protein